MESALPHITLKKINLGLSRRSSLIDLPNRPKNFRISIEKKIKDPSPPKLLARRLYPIKSVPHCSIVKSCVNKLDINPLPRKTLILGLDRTLIKISNSKISLPSSLFFSARPYLSDLLVYASEKFEVFVYSSSTKPKVDRILAIIDPENKYIKGRFYREHCSKTLNGYVKDLEILGDIELKNTIFVDDQFVSFTKQPLNGLKVLPWDGSLNDKELLNLIAFLKTTERSDDVRVNIHALKIS